MTLDEGGSDIVFKMVILQFFRECRYWYMLISRYIRALPYGGSCQHWNDIYLFSWTALTEIIGRSTNKLVSSAHTRTIRIKLICRWLFCSVPNLSLHSQCKGQDVNINNIKRYLFLCLLANKLADLRLLLA